MTAAILGENTDLLKHSTVAVSTVGVKNDKDWNNEIGNMFKVGYDEILNRLEPTTILW